MQGLQEQCLMFPSKGSKNRFPCRVARFPRTGLQAIFARTGSQARVRRTGSQEQVRVPRTNSLGRFRAIGCQHGSHEDVPKHGFRSLMFPGTAFQETTCKAKFQRTSASKVGSKNRIPSKVPKGQVPKQGSQAKLRKTSSRARSQWTGLKQAGKVFQEQVPKRKFPRTGYQAMLPRAGS